MRRNLYFLVLSFIAPFLSEAQTAQYDIFVSSTGNNAVSWYDEFGTQKGYFIQPNSGGLLAPQDIFFLPNGNLLVTGISNSSIKEYDRETGAYIGDYTTGFNLSSPAKMRLGPDGLLYVTQFSFGNNTEVVRFNLDGTFHSEFTNSGAPRALGMVWDVDDNLYVSLYASNGNGVIRRYDKNGNSLGDFIDSSILQGPTDLWWLENGDLIVQDWTAFVVRRYDSNGNFKNNWSTQVGQSEGYIFLPDSTYLIPDWLADAVHRLDTGGGYISAFASDATLNDPNGINFRPVLKVGIEDKLPKITLHVLSGPESRKKVIEFFLPKPGRVQLEAIDMKGRSYPISSEANFSSGTHQISWDIMDKHPGVYIIKMKTTGEEKIIRIAISN